VTERCMTNGSYYTNVLCGPRGSEDLSFGKWRQLYAQGHENFDIDIVQSYAGLMMQRSMQMGGAAAGEDAALAQETADSWFFRKPNLPEVDQAARFTYLMCRAWRKSDAGQMLNDAPQRFDDFAAGSFGHITSSWAYETCKRGKFRVYGDVSRSIHNFGLELAMCLEDQVQCKKNFEECVGGCSGDLTSSLKYDFNTMIAISELNPDVLGEDGFYAAAADCNVRQGLIEVPLFEGGDRWVLTRALTRTLLPTRLRLTDCVLIHYVQFQDVCGPHSDAVGHDGSLRHLLPGKPALVRNHSESPREEPRTSICKRRVPPHVRHGKRLHQLTSSRHLLTNPFRHPNRSRRRRLRFRLLLRALYFVSLQSRIRTRCYYGLAATVDTRAPRCLCRRWTCTPPPVATAASAATVLPGR